ncbi:MAG TPA: glycosyltransferase family 25 protein [Stellaceae bacterium]|nr:glycosyltransferase family 25 protein [Stellaceae bacterium]
MEDTLSGPLSLPGAATAEAPSAAIPAFLITLARRRDRRERFLRWNSGKGIDFAVFDAVDGRTLNRRGLLDAGLIDDEKLNFTDGQFGNALSHRALWERCSALGRPILVFEDDAFVAETVPQWFARIADELAQGCDILYLGYNRDALLSVGFGGGEWCNIVFQTPAAGFEYHARQHSWWSRRNTHCVLDTRLVWGTLAYAVSPAGAETLLRHCLPLSNKHPVRMFGSGTMLTPYGMDGMINVAVQRGLVKARVVFPPLAIGPNDHADSDTLARPG